MIETFLRRSLLFSLVVGTPLLLLSLLLPRLGIEPVLTESISYDLKLGFAAAQNAQHYDIISIGSSITLNNLHSETLLEAFPAGASYLNLASFNASISNSLATLRTVVPRYRPQTILLMSNHIDFESPKWRGLPPRLLKLYLDQKLLPYFYWRRFNLYDLLQRQRRKRRFMSEARANMQQQLRMDAYGGVPLRVSPHNLDPNRKDSAPISQIDPKQYQALYQLVGFLRFSDVKLIFVQSPLRLSSCQSDSCRSFQAEHIQQTRRIVESAGYQFVDLYHQLDLADSLFCDELHLNFDGPQIATQALIEHLKARY
ncbi:MAG: hypothetical protein AAF927_00885 [Bacteroidota bacterium]